MPLHLLRATPALAICYDSDNDWLFLDWQQDVDLRTLQLACLELALVCLPRSYPRVLHNAHLLGTNWEAAAWLASDLLPCLAAAGIEQVAWVSGRSTRGYDVVHDLVQRRPDLPITFFDDLEMAATWLQRTRPLPNLTARPVRNQAQLEQAVRFFTRRVRRQVRELTSVPQAASYM